MTLQQKILAKQSKKGFTLVELVVVIAILAILAAIAIPSVIGIINSATTSSGQSDAATLDSECKSFYGAVVSGSVNAQSTTKTFSTALPNATDSNKQKHNIAITLTPRDAEIYAGLAINFDDMVYVTSDTTNYSQGTIVYAQDAAVTATAGELNGKTAAVGTGVTASVNFGTMYNESAIT